MNECSIPLCASCGHNHEQGVKCSICGHVGKSQIFLKMRLKSSEKRSLRVDHFGSYGSQINDLLIDIITDLRLIDNGRTDLTSEKINVWDEEDGKSCHALTSIGDLPVACIRYRIIPYDEANSIFTVVFEKLIVHPFHRRRKVCLRTFLHILVQFSQSIPFLQKVHFIVPSNSWMEAKSMQLGFQQINSSPYCSFDSYHESLLILELENNQKLYDLIAFLRAHVDNNNHLP